MCMGTNHTYTGHMKPWSLWSCRLETQCVHTVDLCGNVWPQSGTNQKVLTFAVH